MSAHYTTLCAFRAHFKHHLLCFLLLFISTNLHAKPANILVSIKPLHSIISSITEGINQTELLLQQQQSPHDFQLRPSQKRRINQATFFFYSSDNIESFVPALKKTSGQLQFIELSRITGITALPVRSFHFHHEVSTGHNTDGHIWLSINNTVIIARYVTTLLSKNSPENSARYHQNLSALLNKLQTLKQQNQQLLSPYKNTAYLVYHDAYQYFEQENHLSQAHFITSGPQHSPGIKRVTALRKLIRTESIHCIFYEPPGIPPLLNTLGENNSVRLAALDPAGSQIAAGKTHYFKLMRQTAATLSACFSKK